LDFTGARCPKFPVIKNGFVTDMSRDYYFGDEARVQCYKGYKLTGSNIIKCGIGQEFLNPPKCEGQYPSYLIDDSNSRREMVQIPKKSAYKATKSILTNHHESLKVSVMGE